MVLRQYKAREIDSEEWGHWINYDTINSPHWRDGLVVQFRNIPKPLLDGIYISLDPGAPAASGPTYSRVEGTWYVSTESGNDLAAPDVTDEWIRHYGYVRVLGTVAA